MGRKHPQTDLYTPMTPEVYALLEQMKTELGTWRRVCYVSGTRLKVLRNLRGGKRKAVSMTFLDRLITTTGIGSLEDYIWFTGHDLVALGIWKPVLYVEGNQRIQGDEVWQGRPKEEWAPLLKERKKELKRKRRKAEKDAKKVDRFWE